MTDDEIVVIDFSVKASEIDNLNALPLKALIAMMAADNIQSRGFQEINGYTGRQCIWSCGGYWTNRELPRDQQKFHITSMGNGTQLFVE